MVQGGDGARGAWCFGVRLWVEAVGFEGACGREGGAVCGCCVPLREKDEACGAWAVMMRTVWGIVMRFMVAASRVVWVGGVFRVVFSDEILFMVLKHLCPRVCLFEKMVRRVISTIIGIVDQTAVKVIVALRDAW
ncbi:hypothetical protein [Bartonella sp. ML70XJBT]|uniref:hypothetical protein n=1 Tax=Bartonella sp. ML70XJBT TaxID=3019096 RepID=UPI00235FBBC6|nr:hypothetical protein [Bartonella sp. ML70XJBT]